MIFAYLRISSDKSTLENQRFEITQWSQQRHLKIDQWFEETISSRKELEKRYLSRVLKSLREGDTLIVSALSRLGRNLMEVMGILSTLMKKNVRMLTVQEGYELGDNMTSKVLAFAFGLAAEIEREMISTRTKEALRRLKAEGRILGRPKGSKSHHKKLSSKDEKIEELLRAGVSMSAIGRILKVHRLTVAARIQEVESLRTIYSLDKTLRGRHETMQRIEPDEIIIERNQ